MKIQFLSVGKAHEPYVSKGVDEFTRRAGNYFQTSWNILPVPRNAASLPPAEWKQREAESILKAIQSTDYVVLLDERGRSFSSEDLATFLQSRANESTRTLVFLIGGAFGTDESVHRRANFVWSLSALTFPHQLVRLVVAEQVYRACTILRNEKYHHS